MRPLLFALCLLLPAAPACKSSPEDSSLLRLRSRAKAAPRPDLAPLLAAVTGPASPAAPLEPVTLPLLAGKGPLVRARAGGADLAFLVDTGSSGVVLTPQAAEAARAYVPPEGKTVVPLTPGFQTALAPGVLDSLSLGPNRFGPLSIAVATRSIVPAGLRADGDAYGVLGCSVLSHFRVTLDFKKRELRLDPGEGGADGRPLFVHARIDGRSFLLLVDSGANGLFLEPWAATRLGLIDDADEWELAQRSQSVETVRMQQVFVRRMTVAGRIFRHLRASVVATFQGMKGIEGGRPAGLLGLPGLGPLVWTIDFSKGHILVHD